MKLGPDDASLKFSAKPSDVSLRGRYTVGEGETAAGDIASLLADTYSPNLPQKLVDMDGNAISGACQIEGYVIVPKAGMTEKTGQKIFGNGFLTLVCYDPETGYSQALQPLAMISQAKGDKPRRVVGASTVPRCFCSRWAGGAEQPMAFEFMMPRRSSRWRCMSRVCDSI